MPQIKKPKRQIRVQRALQQLSKGFAGGSWARRQASRRAGRRRKSVPR